MFPAHGAIRFRAALLLAALFCPINTRAQATTASVEGRVQEQGGAPLSGAQVEIRSRETGAVRNAVTNANGDYRLFGITPGSYDILGRAIGYRPTRRDSVDLVVDEVTRVDLELSSNTGAFTLEPVVVVGTASRDVERMDVSNAVLEREIERLPLNGRDALSLAATTPGVRSFAVATGRSPPTTGAPNSNRYVNLYVDGAEWKGFNGLVGQPATGSLFPQEAIREFRVVLNPYDVEFGHAGAWAMSAITHQGSNEVHGSLFGYGQSAQLIARSRNQLDKPDYSRNQVGANLRGAIVHDHIFYALSYEGQNTDAYVDVVPPRPTYAPDVWDRYAGTFRAPFHDQMGMARITALYGSHTIDAIWSDRRLTTTSSFGTLTSGVLPSYDAAQVSTYGVSTAQLRDRWVSGAFSNELSLTYLNDHQDDEPRILGPVYQYPDLQASGRTSFPLLQIMRSTGLTEHVSYAARGWGGEHALKAGVELARVWSEAFQPLSRDGLFVFAKDTSTLPARAQIGMNFPDTNGSAGAATGAYAWTTSAYLQDEWQPSRSLRLAVGVRYDADINSLNQGYDSPWMNDTTLQRLLGPRYLDSRHRKNDLDNFAPRIAASWDVDGTGRTSLRGGYGVMYDRIPRTAPFYERIAWTWRTYLFLKPGTTDPAQLRQRALAGQGLLGPPQFLPQLLETPRTDQWSFGVGRRLTNHLTLQMDYLDQALSHLPVTVRMNATAPLLTSRFAPMTIWGSFGDGSYRAILSALTYERGATRMTAAYTLGWSKAEFLGASDAGYPDSASYNMQWASTDERHRIVLSGITDGPFGLQLSTIATVASPHPYPITVGPDANGDGVFYDDWPNGIRSARAHGWSNWYRNIDVRVGRAIGVASGRLIATADVFNVFNTANHSDYRAPQTSSDYGLAIGDYARRQAQLGLRYQF